MGTVFCDNCGTSIEESAKFCRACGRPTPLSEAATKRFDEQAGFQTPTSPVGPSLTTPAYMAPFELPAAQQTNDLRQKAQRRNLILVVAMMAVMIFALGGLLLFLNSGPPGRTADIPPVGAGPSGPGQTGTPPIPAVPPVPPMPPGIAGPAKIDPSLIYPGATQTMSIGGEDGKGVLQLHSDDSAKKVTDWYLSKLKATKKVSIAGQTILQAGEISVMIMGGDDGAEILITRGD